MLEDGRIGNVEKNDYLVLPITMPRVHDKKAPVPQLMPPTASAPSMNN